LADIISAVRCERAFRVEESFTGASPLIERAKFTARRVAAREAAEVDPAEQRESLPVQPVPRSSPGAKARVYAVSTEARRLVVTEPDQRAVVRREWTRALAERDSTWTRATDA
jgi:hypothetical protein